MRKSVTLAGVLAFALPISLLTGPKADAIAASAATSSATATAAHPDFNGDGYADLVISASNDDVVGASAAGRAWVLYGGPHGANTGDRHVYLTESDIGRGAHSDKFDRFGIRWASGDFNGDGYDDLALGAPGDRAGDVAEAGGVMVVYGSGFGLETIDAQYFTEATSGLGITPQKFDSFGSALAAGDFNADGIDDLAVAAVGTPVHGHPFSGAVYELFGTRNRLSHAAPLLPRRFDETTPGVHGGIADFDHFGGALMPGDYNADGFTDLAVSVPGKDVSGMQGAGAVDVFPGASNGLTGTGVQTWTQDTTGVPDDPELADLWGTTMAALDVNGDGCSELVVGSPQEGQGAKNVVGSATLLYGSSHMLTAAGAAQYLVDNTTFGQVSTAENFFASSLAALDFDGDGRPDLAIGVEGHVANTKAYSGEVVVLHNVGGRLSRTGGFVVDRDTPGLIGPSQAGAIFGARLVAGDFSGNGRDDLAVSVPGLTVSGLPGAGAVQVLYGASTGFAINDQQFSANSLGGTAKQYGSFGGYEFDLG